MHRVYQPDVGPVGAIYSEEHLPDGSPTSAKYNAEDSNKGHDHTFFVQNSRDVFADKERLKARTGGSRMRPVSIECFRSGESARCGNL